jgi:alginate O-acetyltransferase complex protein AlgI
MAFSSPLYPVFLLAVLFVAAALTGRLVSAFLLVASLLFYAWGDVGKIPVLVAVIAGAHAAALVIGRRRSLLWLWTSIVLIASPLIYFKYYAFVPVIGISFFTFQAIGYVVDVYRGQLQPERNIRRCALFLSFFPLILAGPIERSTHLLPQLDALENDQWQERSDLAAGVFLILKGLLLKLVFADNFGVYVDGVYSELAGQPAGNAAWACYLYSAQIYCDFYGYSLVALGSARLFGIDLINNFLHPYQAANIGDFWRRWHVSLTSWLRDYVFFPLGGLRKSVNRYRNTFITMLLCGLWHGAGVTFVLWGAMHGVALMVHRLWASLSAGVTESWPPALKTVVRGLAVFLTFNFVTASWILFRADNPASAQLMGQKVVEWVLSPSLPLGDAVLPFYVRLAAAFVLFEFLDARIDFTALFRRTSMPLQVAWVTAWFCCLYFAPMTQMRFIYFRF